MFCSIFLFSCPIDEIEVLPEDLYDHEVDLTKVTTLEQRLVQLDIQPVATKDLFPRHKYLMIKRSQRCRKCEHNLSKPEYNPTSIKFKIQLAAYYHIPEIIIYQVQNPDFISAGTQCHFTLKIGNPTQHPTTVEIMSLEDHLSNLKGDKSESETDTDKPVSDHFEFFYLWLSSYARDFERF